MKERRQRILLIEDSLADANLIAELLADIGSAIELATVHDGKAALEYLQGAPRFAGAFVPDIILLDLNLPGLDGREVLSEIKANPAFASIPVIILSTSNAPTDIVDAYRLHANCYIIKPLELEEFATALRKIHEYWFEYASLPLVLDRFPT